MFLGASAVANMDFKWFQDYGDYFYLGMLFPSGIIVGTLMGYFVDKWFHTDPWGKIIGFIFGAFAGGYNFYRDYKKLINKDDSGKS